MQRSNHRVQRALHLCLDLGVVVAGVRLVELLPARVDRRDIVVIGVAARRLTFAPLLDPLDRDAAVSLLCIVAESGSS